MKKRGRKPITGRFDTREELIERVLHLYYATSCSMDMIARNVKVSAQTVKNIIENNPRRE